MFGQGTVIEKDQLGRERIEMASRTHLTEEVSAFCAVEKPVPNASIHGGLIFVSPVKKRRNSSYFEGAITDSDSKLRFVDSHREQ